MAKSNDTGTGLDEIDKILASLEEDGGLDFGDEPKDDREGIKGVAKNIRDGFLDSFKSDPKGKMIDFVDDALPKSITREINFLKETAAEATKVYDKSAKEIKSGMKSTIDIVKSKLDQDSGIHKLLNKISKKLDSDEDNSSNVSSGPSNESVIAGTLTELFGKNRKIDEITEKVKDIKENKKFEINLLNSNKIVSSTEGLYKFHQQYTLNYYRKSIELKLKTLFVNKELLEVTKKASEASIRQFEAIIHNTSLPDLTKLRNSEQFKETIKGRMRENMADMFLPAMRPLEVFKKGIAEKVSSTMESITSGLSMGLNTYDMVQNTGGMASTLGGMGADSLQGIIADMVSQKLEDMPSVRKALKKTKLAMADPSQTFLDMASSLEEKNTVFSRFAANRLRELGFMSQTKSVENKRFIEGHPDDVTLFDYKTKNSIVKIIPTILGKIYGEVKSIRTGEEPSKIYYDWSTGKIEDSKSFSTRIENKVSLALDSNVKGEMSKFLSIVDKEGTMSQKTNNNVMSALIDHLSRGGSISPGALLKSDFLSKLDNEDKEIFSSKLGKILDPNNDSIDAMTIGDLSDILFSVKTNTPHIDSLIKEFYTNGQIEEVEAMGLVIYDPLTGAYTVNKDMYANIIRNVILNTNKGTNGGSYNLKEEIKKVSKDDIAKEIRNSRAFKIARVKAKKIGRKAKGIFKKGRKVNFENSKVFVNEKIDEAKNSDFYKISKEFYNNDTKTNLKNMKEYLETNFANMKGSEEYNNIKSMLNTNIDKFVNTEAYKTGKKFVDDKTEEVKKSEAFMAAKDNIVNSGFYKKGKKAYLKTKKNGYVPKSIREILNSDKIDAESMHDLFLASNINIGFVTLKEWARSLGFKQVNDEFVKVDKDDSVEEAKQGMMNHVINYFKSFVADGKNSKGIKGLFEIEAGMTPLMVMHKVIQKTREWDTKIVKSIPKMLWKTIKGAWNVGKAIGKGGIKGLFSRNTANVLRVLFGAAPKYDDKSNPDENVESIDASDNTKNNKSNILSKLHDLLQKTRGLDKSTVKKTPSAIWNALKKSKTLFDTGMEKSHVGESLWDILKVLAGKAPDKKSDKDSEKKFNDRDNDGIRDNSWEDRLNDEDKKDVKEKMEPVKDKEKKESGIWGFLKSKLLWIGGILASGLDKLGLLKHLTKIVPAITALGTMLAKGWGAAKYVGGKTVSLAKTAKTFVTGSMAATTVASSIGGAATTVGAATVASKVTKGGILSTLRNFKGDIIKKYGKKGGAKLLAKLTMQIAVRAAPVAGVAMLAYDAAMVVADMIKNGTSLKSAISKQVLGFDLFNDDEVARDENGNPIEPDKSEVFDSSSEVDPNLDYYVRETLRIARAELEYGTKDEEGRAKLQEFKDKHKLKDADILKHYNRVKIEELTKARAGNKSTSEEIDALKKQLTDNVNKTKQENNQGQIGGHGDSAYGDGTNTNKNLSEKAALQRLKNADNAVSNSWNGFSEDIKPNGNITIKGKEDILAILDKAAEATGVDASTLKSFAAIESGFNTKVKNKDSSATGLFQFVTDTWNEMLRKYGKKYGLGMDAKREDPMANALMGAEYLKENQALLGTIGRGKNLTDLYLAHFLGGGGAMKLFKSPLEASVTGNVNATSLSANKNVFYKSGRAITNGELYKWAENKVKSSLAKYGTSTSTATDTTNASVTTTPPMAQNNSVSTTPDVSKYTPSTEGDNVVKNEISNNAMTTGFNPTKPVTKVSMEGTSPIVESKGNYSMDVSSTNDILKESLTVQKSMDEVLKNIYKYFTEKKEAIPALNKDQASITMPSSLYNLDKKRFN